MEITVGARSSPLSQEQAREVWREISAFHPCLRFCPLWTVTSGDTDRTTPLWNVSKTDFFTKEIDEKLLQGSCRIAIHSAKDLPSPLPNGLSLIALTQGIDPRDSLVMRPMMTLATLPPNARIGTSSKRREAILQQLRNDFLAVDIRGTIDERLKLLHTGSLDAIIVAEAALIRLKRTDEHRILLDGETEPLQGRLAVVARADDQEMASLFAPIDTRKRVVVVGPSVPQCLKNDLSLTVVHTPLIQLQALPVTIEDLLPITNAHGVILTSKHAASFLYEALHRFHLSVEALRFFCVGKATAAMTRELFPKSEIATAQDSTQEGLADLLSCHPGSFFWPRSTHARRYLPEALGRAGKSFTELSLYTPIPSSTPCSLAGIDTVFFTCPSSVDAFFDVIEKPSKSLSMLAIGPVTQERLKARLSGAPDCLAQRDLRQ